MATYIVPWCMSNCMLSQQLCFARGVPVCTDKLRSHCDIEQMCSDIMLQTSSIHRLVASEGGKESCSSCVPVTSLLLLSCLSRQLLHPYATHLLFAMNASAEANMLPILLQISTQIDGMLLLRGNLSTCPGLQRSTEPCTSPE